MNILWHMPILRQFGCGLSRRAVELARRLRARGHRVTFLVRRNRTDASEGAIESLPVLPLDLPDARPWHWSVQALSRRAAARELVSRIDPDHDVFMSCQPEVVAAYGRRPDARPVLFVCGGSTLLHDESDIQRLSEDSWTTRLSAAIDRRLKHANERAAFASADAVVFDSNQTRKRVADTYGIAHERHYTVHGGVDPEEMQPADSAVKRARRGELGIRDGDFVLCWTGRLSPEKNVELLIRSIRLCTRRPDVVLIVGDGPCQRDLADLVSSAGLRDTVRLIGAVADVQPYLYVSDAFVFPSKGESFGGSLVEAMACGLPCIALRPDGDIVCTATEEVFDGGRCGYFVDTPVPGALASAIDALAADAELRRRLGERARRYVVDQFTWDAAGARLSEIVLEIGKRARTAEALIAPATQPSAA